MEAKIKKTGEIVNVSCMMADYGRSQQDMFDIYIESTFFNARTFTKDELEFISMEDEHWQDVRERAAIAAMGQLIGMGRDDGYKYSPSEVANYAVVYANALIEKLKN